MTGTILRGRFSDMPIEELGMRISLRACASAGRMTSKGRGCSKPILDRLYPDRRRRTLRRFGS